MWLPKDEDTSEIQLCLDDLIRFSSGTSVNGTMHYDSQGLKQPIRYNLPCRQQDIHRIDLLELEVSVTIRGLDIGRRELYLR